MTLRDCADVLLQALLNAAIALVAGLVAGFLLAHLAPQITSFSGRFALRLVGVPLALSLLLFGLPVDCWLRATLGTKLRLADPSRWAVSGAVLSQLPLVFLAAHFYSTSHRRGVAGGMELLYFEGGQAIVVAFAVAGACLGYLLAGRGRLAQAADGTGIIPAGAAEAESDPVPAEPDAVAVTVLVRTQVAGLLLVLAITALFTGGAIHFHRIPLAGAFATLGAWSALRAHRRARIRARVPGRDSTDLKISSALLKLNAAIVVGLLVYLFLTITSLPDGWWEVWISWRIFLAEH